MYKYAEIGDVVYFWFAANATTGAAGDGATPLYDVRLAGAAAGAAPTASGTPTLLTHADYSDGLFEIAISTTAWAAGEYAVFCTLTISTVNPAGFCGSFKLRAVGAAALNVDLIAAPNSTALVAAATAVRTNLATELGRIDVAVSTRNAIAPATPTDISNLQTHGDSTWQTATGFALETGGQLDTIAEDVAGLDGDAMRGTDDANKITPATPTDISDLQTHGDAAWITATGFYTGTPPTADQIAAKILKTPANLLATDTSNRVTPDTVTPATDVSTIQAATNKINTMLEASGLNYTFTVDAVKNAVSAPITGYATESNLNLRTLLAANYATDAKQVTAQNDLDLLTGADGVTLATLQANYAPAKAGNEMALTSTAISAIKSGLATLANQELTLMLLRNSWRKVAPNIIEVYALGVDVTNITDEIPVETWELFDNDGEPTLNNIYYFNRVTS
jgi:hypothetical protein